MGELAEIISFPSSRIATVVSQRSHDRTELKGPKKVATKRQKRSQGEGSIFPVSGREGYRAQFQREDGSRITKHVKTRQEASDWINAQRVLALKGHQTSANTPKLGEWMDAWMDRRTVSPKTINSERSVRRLYFKKLEHVPLDKLTPGTIKRWLAEIEADGKRKKPGVGQPYVVRTCYLLLSGVLTGAIDDEIISVNPIARVKRPSIPKPPPKYLTEDEIAVLLGTDFGARSDPRRLAVMFMLWLGLRRGEALGLTWQEIDFESAELSVRQQLYRLTDQRGVSRLVRRDLKTATSMRTLPLSAELVQSLIERRGALTIEPQPDDYVISYDEGGPIDPDAFSKWLKETTANSGIEVSAHRLRHTAATLMLNRIGSIEQVSSFLGHADIQTTAVYARITPYTRSQAASELGSLLDGQLERATVERETKDHHD